MQYCAICFQRVIDMLSMGLRGVIYTENQLFYDLTHVRSKQLQTINTQTYYMYIKYHSLFQCVFLLI